MDGSSTARSDASPVLGGVAESIVGGVVMVALLGALAVTPAGADDLRSVLHLRAWADQPLRDLSGPSRTEGYLGMKVDSDPAEPGRVKLLNRSAWQFDTRRNTRIYLGQGEDRELRITGPITLAAVVAVDEFPASKAAVISKWQLIDGGRAYELGVGADRGLYFHVSASGKWPLYGAEIVGERRLEPGVPYLIAGSFDPGRRMEVSINGVRANEAPLTRGVPRGIFDTTTPVLIGSRPGGGHGSGLTGRVGEVWIFNKALTLGQLERLTRRADVTSEVKPLPPVPKPPYDLDAVRDAVRGWYRSLQAPDHPYGAYRLNPKVQPDLYASADIAWIRWMMDDLAGVSDAERTAWIEFIRAQQRPDGRYRHITKHIATHAFCHATGALNMLGGKHKYEPKLLEKYRDIERMDAWLAGIDWRRPWGASHDIWGAGVPLACTPSTPDTWREALFDWLNREVDPKTGMWRRGVPDVGALELLGGAFHIWPIYAALERDLPYPERVIDHVLGMRKPNGSFDGGFGYGNMDGVWVLAYLMERTGHRRDEVREALRKNIAGLMKAYVRTPHRWLSDAHSTESRVATLAIVSEVLPELFGGRSWRNPWHRRELFVIRHGE